MTAFDRYVKRIEENRQRRRNEAMNAEIQRRLFSRTEEEAFGRAFIRDVISEAGSCVRISASAFFCKGRIIAAGCNNANMSG